LVSFHNWIGSVIILFTFFRVSFGYGQCPVIYAAVLSNNQYVVGAKNAPTGLVVSADHGDQWGRLCWPNCRAFDVEVDPGSNGQIIYIAGGNGLLKTINGGLDWRIMTGWQITEVQDVEMCPLDSSWIIIGTAYGAFVSEDEGYTWEKRNQGLMVTFCSALEVDAYHSSRAWIGTEAGLFVTEDRGKNWTCTGLDKQAIRSVIQDPHHTEHLLAGTEDHGIYQSKDHGLTWKACKGKLNNLTIYDITFHPFKSDTIFAGSHGKGVWISQDGGDSWRRTGKGLENPVIHAVTVLIDKTEEFILAGTINRGIYRSADGGRSWRQVGLPGAQVWELTIQEVRRK
jgi:photosystem II stability/assembly factor-like uncharacterized protein